MTHKYGVGITILLVLSGAAPRAEASTREQRQITWEGLSAIVGRKVRIVLPDGSWIEAKAKAVETDALAVDIRKSSKPAAHPNGPFLVPRATLRAVDLPHPTKRWRALGLSVGGGIGTFFAIIAIDVTSSRGVGAAMAAEAVGMGLGGYMLGRAADRRTITFVIKP